MPVEEGRGRQKKRCELVIWADVQGQLTKKCAGGLLGLVACMLSRFSRLTLCNPVDCSLPGSSVQNSEFL